MKKILTVLIVTLFLCGCYTQKKAENQAYKGLERYPIPVGKVFRDKFPCIEGQVFTGDSSAIKEWMAATKETADFYEALLKNIIPDTVIEYKKEFTENENYSICVDKYNQLYKTHSLLKVQFEKLLQRKPAIRVDTIKVKDTYDLAAAISSKEKCETDFRKLSEERAELQKKNKISVWENWIWRIVAGVLIILFFVVKRK